MDKKRTVILTQYEIDYGIRSENPDKDVLVPLEALEIEGDSVRIENCRRILERVNPGNFSKDLEVGRMILDAILMQLELGARYSAMKLRNEFLLPVEKRF